MATKFCPASRRGGTAAVSEENRSSAAQGVPIVWAYLARDGGVRGGDRDGDDDDDDAKPVVCLQPLQTNNIRPASHSLLYGSVSDDSELSEQEFDLHPLIKQELRNSIQKRRWQRGAMDWALEDYDKKRKHNNQLTPDEILKREDRKKRNRQAAAKCRRKRRNELEELHQTLCDLEAQTDELVRLKDQLHLEKNELERMVNDHFALCHSDTGLKGT